MDSTAADAAAEVMQRFKIYIESGNLEACQSYYTELAEEYDAVPWDYIYQKAYLHACLKKQGEIKTWLESMYEHLDPIARIAVRQVFPYGRHLYNRR
jgi:hypothetical protein